MQALCARHGALAVWTAVMAVVALATEAGRLVA